ncbi:MAG: hypothetical protein WC807_08145 [Hyphomicrobium sp.]|jgi:hypothetical protein
MSRKDQISSRERRLRRIVARHGYELRKLRSGKESGRYALILLDKDSAEPLQKKIYPGTFLLDDVEELFP